MNGFLSSFRPRRLALGCLVLIAAGCGRTTDPDPIAVAEDRRQADAGAITTALADADPARRARAARAIGRIQDPASSASLIAALGDETPAVRSAALFALGQLGLADGAEADPAAVAACSSLLRSDDVDTVVTAVEALGKLAPDDLERVVLTVADHPDAGVRSAVADALFRRRFVPTWRGQADEPPELGGAARRWLADALTDESVEVRRAAAHACSRFGEPVALEALALALERDPDELVRLWAARALARRDPASAGGDSSAAKRRRRVAAALAAAGQDRSPRVRVEVLAGLAAHEAFDRIPLAAASDESFHVRAAWAAALAAGDSGGAPHETALRSLLADESPTVRGAALDAMAARRGDEMSATIRGWLAREDQASRLAAIGAAVRIGEPIADALLSIEFDDVPTRVARLDALAEIGVDAERIDPLIDAALGTDDLALRGTAIARIGSGRRESRVERLVAAYDASSGDDRVELREAVLDALAPVPPEEPGDDAERVVTLLRRAATSDPAESVRLRGARALEARGIARPVVTVAPPAPSRLLRAAHTLSGSRPRVELETERGTMTLELFADDAPVHAALFLELVDDGFYDGSNWHRVVPNFVIQGGDPRGDGWGGAGTTLRDEINRRPFRRGSVGMPKAGKDTGGGQLFITHIPTPHLDGNYTVFGQLVDGEAVIDLIDRGDRIVRARRVD